MSRSACIREAIDQYLLRHGDGDEARARACSMGPWSQGWWSCGATNG
ncbi:hypothetical protein IQ220_07795 [Cyanobium sp. LEGE 06113]|nr:hypothetical protein [Cyanobium sp. LEGE 06113]